MFDIWKVYNKFLRDKRALAIFGSVSGCFAVLAFFSEQFNEIFYRFWGISLNGTGAPLLFLMVSLASFSLLYLQSGKSVDISDEKSQMFDFFVRELERQKDRTNIQMKKIAEKLEGFDSREGLSITEKENILNGVIKHVNHDVVTSIFAREADKFREELLSGLSIDRLSNSSKAIIERLKREIADLRLRSNINLIIGMSITTVGVYLLWNTVSMIDTSVLLKMLASEGQESNQKFIKNLVLPLVPRVLLVIFVEVFAYFFLSLYKSGLSEIKYFQNELTNIESKLVAVEFSYLAKNQDGVKLAIESLSKTERNFILEKGQTTVELEKAKSESELTRNIIKTIPSFFKKAEK
ncbi:hypothetical protein [Pseudomonas reinekei]